MEKYILNVNGDSLELTANDLKVLDCKKLGERDLHILKENQAYQTHIAKSDGSNKNLNIIVNGNPYEVTIADPYDQVVEQMGLLSNTSHKINEVKAPMPGLILSIKVEPGQEIQKDDQLLILSAMKMENIILAPGEGIVKTIHAKEGEAVEKGQIIIEME